MEQLDTVVRTAAAGDRQAWEELVRRFAPLIRSVARSHRLSGADADDVVQTTWLRAVEHIGRLDRCDRFGAWLSTVARRECLALLRGRARAVPTDGEVLSARPDESAPIDDALLGAERRAAVRSALGALPTRQRRLLVLLHCEPEPSYAAIGDALRMPIGSIGPTRGRALQRLREQVEHGGLALAA